MKFRIVKIFSFLLIGSSLVLSCKKALDIQPKQSIDAATALNSRDNVNAAITGVYSRFKSARLYGRDLIAIPDALADNGFATNKSGRLNPEANNNSGAHFTGTLWQSSYAGINEINTILGIMNSVSDATAADKINWEGQLLFLRGLFYFNLVEVYAYMPGATVSSQDRGGIPILLKPVKTTGEATLVLPSRAPTDSVYIQIVMDLEGANARLTFNSSSDVSLANKAAAQALLSRVNLYRKNYTETKRWADSCITLAGSKLSNSAGYVNQWRVATHQETLFQIRFGLSSENIGVNESLQTTYTTLSELGNTSKTGGFGDLVPTLSLLNDLGITLVGGNTLTNFSTVNHSIASRSADVRNLLYEPGTAGRGLRKVETTKFFGKNGAINLDNVPVIRISEVYLNRAEAMATQGSPVYNVTAALADLNTIVTNRGLPAFSGLTGTALFDEIFRQRRIEFAFEGHRFFDLKRLGRDLLKGPHYNDVAFTDFRILAPIPTRETDGNPKLRQNFGY
ncbi:MAG: RagB/SusD family nutrient uptake outer membrane protein [Chitinophagaceae bacterium]